MVIFPKQYSFKIKNIPNVKEYIQSIILNYPDAQIKDSNADQITFKIGSLQKAVLYSYPNIMEGFLTIKTNEETIEIKIFLQRTKIWFYILIGTIMFLLIGVFYFKSFEMYPNNGSTFMLIGFIIIAILANILFIYYVIKLESNFVESIKTGFIKKKFDGLKLIYIIGICFIIGLAVVVMFIGMTMSYFGYWIDQDLPQFLLFHYQK